MNKEKIFIDIDLNNYFNDYTCNQLDCIGQTVATSASIYNNDNYYLYAFLNSIFLFWKDEFYNKNFIKSIDNRLQYLGLNFNSYSISDKNELMNFIRYKIDNNIPLIFNPKRNLIPYCSDYGNISNNTEHSILISGYSNQRKCIVLRDISHIESSGINVKFKYGLFKIYLKLNTFLEIWEENKEILKNNESNFKNLLFTIESEQPIIYKLNKSNDIKELFGKFNKDENNLIKSIFSLKEEFEKNKFENLKENTMSYPMLCICNSLSVFMNILEKINYNSNKLNELNRLLDKIYKNLLLCSKNIIKKNELTNLDFLIEVIKEFEQKLINAFI